MGCRYSTGSAENERNNQQSHSVPVNESIAFSRLNCNEDTGPSAVYCPPPPDWALSSEGTEKRRDTPTDPEPASRSANGVGVRGHEEIKSSRNDRLRKFLPLPSPDIGRRNDRSEVNNNNNINGRPTSSTSSSSRTARQPMSDDDGSIADPDNVRLNSSVSGHSGDQNWRLSSESHC